MTGGPERDEHDALVQHMLGVLEDEANHSKRLTKWELDFVESVVDQHARTGSLSAKQMEILERIYSAKTE